MLGQGHGDSGFWLSLAVARSQNALGVLEHVPGGYSLKALYQFVFDERFRTQAIETGARALRELQTREGPRQRALTLAIRRLRTALDYEAAVVPNYAEKEHSGINRTIETALSRFTDPELEDAFCTAAGAQARLTDVLDGKIFIVNVPRERFKAAANVVYMFLKERFFQALNARVALPEGPRKTRPVLFLCDEYQQIVSAGDANFFDTSRALGVVGIVAAQSLEAYMTAIGNEPAAQALLGDFTNLIAFRSTERTMNYVAGKLGDVEIWKENYNPTQTVSSFSRQRQRLLNPQIFRALPPDHAVALLSVGGHAFDDIIRVPQITSDDLDACLEPSSLNCAMCCAGDTPPP